MLFEGISIRYQISDVNISYVPSTRFYKYIHKCNLCLYIYIYTYIHIYICIPDSTSISVCADSNSTLISLSPRSWTQSWLFHWWVGLLVSSGNSFKSTQGIPPRLSTWRLQLPFDCRCLRQCLQSKRAGHHAWTQNLWQRLATFFRMKPCQKYSNISYRPYRLQNALLFCKSKFSQRFGCKW